MPVKKLIKQKHYGDLEINGHEEDIIEIWMSASDPQVIHIELEKIQPLIDILNMLKRGSVCKCGYKSGRECLKDCKSK